MGKNQHFFIHERQFRVDARDLATKNTEISTNPSPQIDLIVDGDDYYSQMIHAINQAQKEVLFETYIFNWDEIGKAVLEALSKAAKRGLQVYFLLDGIGSFTAQNELKAFCLRHQIPLRIFHPVPRGKWGYLSLEIRRWAKFLTVFNNRNHRKMVLVDHSLVFIGSFNVHNSHSHRYSGKKAWRDTAVLLKCIPKDPDLLRLRRAFFSTWARSRRKRFLRFRLPHLQFRKRYYKFGWLRINDQISLRMSLMRDLRSKIKQAQKRILITNAYFLPRRTLISALRKASRRGVFVGLCLPAKTDVWFVREASRSLFRKLIKDGVRIYEYQPSVLHAKTMVIDDWASVGSYNLNHRSSLHDLEVEVGSTEPTFVKQMIRQWDLDLQKSNPITLKALDSDSFFRKTLSKLLFLLRYFL